MSIFDQVEADVKAAAPEVAKIVTVFSKPQPGSKTGKVLFEGLVEDAQKFIENNFPRIHSEEAGPDYYTEEKDSE